MVVEKPTMPGNEKSSTELPTSGLSGRVATGVTNTVNDTESGLKRRPADRSTGTNPFFGRKDMASTSEGRPVDRSSSKGGSSRPSKKKFNDLRNALHIIKRLGSVDPSTLSTRESDSLQWAQNTVETGKRQRSPDEKPIAKRKIRTSENISHRSFASVAKDSLVLAVVDRGAEDGIIPKTKWNLIEAAMSRAYIQALEQFPGPCPDCESVGWFQGRFKLIAFEDQRSVNVYRAALKLVGEIWEGAALELVEKKDVPARPRAHAWIPDYPADPESILGRIRDCNPQLPTEDWRVGRLGEAEDSRRQVVFILNSQSIPHLNKSLGHVKYGFIKIQM